MNKRDKGRLIREMETSYPNTCVWCGAARSWSALTAEALFCDHCTQRMKQAHLQPLMAAGRIQEAESPIPPYLGPLVGVVSISEIGKRRWGSLHPLDYRDLLTRVGDRPDDKPA